MGDMWDIATKQMRDSFSKKTFLGVIGLFMVLTLASVYLGISSFESQMENFLDPGNSFSDEPSFLQIYEPLVQLSLPLVAGLLGIIISYNSISKERRDGTMEMLLSYPVYRDEIINGKIVGNIFIVAFSLLIAFAATSGLAVYMLESVPGIEDISRLAFIWIGTTVYITFFVGLGTFLSTLFRSQWRSLVGGVLLLMFFIATPFIAGIAAGQIYEMPEPELESSPPPAAVETERSEREIMDQRLDDVEPEQDTEQRREEVREQRESFVQTASRLSPTNTYSQYVENMLGTSYRVSDGADPTFAESLNDSLDALIYLLSQVAMMFAATYTVFLRQDL